MPAQPLIAGTISRAEAAQLLGVLPRRITKLVRADKLHRTRRPGSLGARLSRHEGLLDDVRREPGHSPRRTGGRVLTGRTTEDEAHKCGDKALNHDVFSDRMGCLTVLRSTPPAINA
jgi:hypothetical protein